MVMTAYNNLNPWEESNQTAKANSFKKSFNGGFLLTTPKGVNCLILGGPYINMPKADMIGIKMAVEIHKPCHINIPTEDFDVPSVEDLRRGLIKAIVAIAKGKTLYVGCMGGIGRTGLFMAALLKIYLPNEDPIEMTRSLYIPHAVETTEQQKFINSLPVDDLIELTALT